MFNVTGKEINSNNQGSIVKKESTTEKIKKKLASLKNNIKRLIDKYNTTKQSDKQELQEKIKEYNHLNGQYTILSQEEKTIQEQLNKVKDLTNAKSNDPNSNKNGSKVTQLVTLYNKLKEKEENLDKEINELNDKVNNLEQELEKINNYVDNFVKEEEEEINKVLKDNNN